VCPVRGASFNVSYVNFLSIFYFLFLVFAMPRWRLWGWWWCCRFVRVRLLGGQLETNKTSKQFWQHATWRSREGTETHRNLHNIFGLSWNSLLFVWYGIYHSPSLPKSENLVRKFFIFGEVFLWQCFHFAIFLLALVSWDRGQCLEGNWRLELSRA